MTGKTLNDDRWARVVGQNLRELRVLRGITQMGLVNLLLENGFHLHQSRVSRLETWSPDTRGSYVVVTVDMLMALAEALDVSPSELLMEE